MQVVWALVVLFVLAAFETLAFVGIRLALRGDGHRRRSRAMATVYWLTSAAVLGAVVAGSLFGPRDADGESRIPAGVIVAAAAVFLPKIGLAILTLLDLILRSAVWLIVRALGRPAAGGSGWLTRTRFLPRLGLGLACLTLAAIVWEATLGRSDVRIYRHEIVSESLPAEFDGLRIVHLSDIHAPSLGSSAARLADRLVAAVNAERPDVVVYTGDYGEAGDFDDGPDILGRLRARLGKFAVLGNHDFGARERAADNWTSADDKHRKTGALARAFRSRGFTLLTNDATVLTHGPGGIAILGVGVHDPHHGFDDADLEMAERAAGAASFRLLIAHSPQYWESAVQGRRTIDLTLVGHTHGAQVGIGIGSLVWSPASLQFTRWGGLYRDGRQYLNVNRGTGFVGLPFRLNMPADVSLVVVRSGRATRGADSGAR